MISRPVLMFAGALLSACIALPAADAASRRKGDHRTQIMVTIIDHSKQRYATVGDWHFDKRGNLSVKVSALSDRRYEFLVAAHEMVEAMLCREAGVSERTVDAFDMVYEKHRKRGDDSEPGDDPRAPYRRQHQIATVIERRLARALGVDWVAYGREIASK